MSTETLIESNYELVRDFHRKFNQDLDKPLVSDKTLALRCELIAEEVEELVKELEKNKIDKASVAKELADILYVVYGFGVTYGIDLDEAFWHIHQSNLSKLGDDGKPLYRHDGKVLKGQNYKPPQLEFIFK